MRIETLTSDQVERYLDLATSAAKLSAQNMANVDTPGYRAVNVNFESEMKTAITGTEAGKPSLPVHIQFEDGLVARPDGNNVSVDRESLNLAEAQLQFKTGVALLRQQYQMVMNAIHADGK